MPFVSVNSITGALVLLYGKEGIGKTSAHRGLPPDKTLYMNVDGSGARVLSGTSMQVYIPDDFYDMQETLRNSQAQFIVFDCYSSYLESLLWERKASKGEGKTRKDGGFLTMSQYGEAAELARIVLNELSCKAAEGAAVIVLAHETIIGFNQAEEICPILYRLSGQDAAREKFKAACQSAYAKFDMIGRMMDVKNSRGIAFEGDAYVAKNRLGWPKGIEAAQWSSFLVEQFLTKKEAK